MKELNHSKSRRKFLSLGAKSLGMLTVAAPIANAFVETCRVTPAQTAGPFYPGEREFKVDQDLTQIPNRPRAQGKIVYIKGRVLDADCKPVVNANVEIWQACASGKYNNPKDPNPAPLDPNFKYWSEAYTNEAGEYLFKTIIPGAYPADNDWDRPPHIHFKISKLGYRDLVTQMYFKGHALNLKHSP